MALPKLLRLDSKTLPVPACDAACRYDALRDRTIDRLAMLRPSQ